MQGPVRRFARRIGLALLGSVMRARIRLRRASLRPLGYAERELIVAVNSGRGPAVDTILRTSGVDVKLAGEYGVLSVAARRNDLDVLRRLIGAGFNVNQPEKTTGCTALVRAARSGSDGAVRILLEYGADTSVDGIDGIRALSGAAMENRLTVVELLLDAGAPINQRSANGYTALMYAAAKGHDDVVRMLLARGANPAIIGDRGVTAQGAATDAGHMSTVRILDEVHGRKV